MTRNEAIKAAKDARNAAYKIELTCINKEYPQ